MTYLLDTNVVSEFRKAGQMNAGVARWRDQQATSQLVISVATIGEIESGIARLALNDTRQSSVLQFWLLEILRDYDRQILPITLGIARRWGSLCPRQPLPSVDGYIAATALEHNLIVVTRNARDFVRAGVQIVNPFE